MKHGNSRTGSGSNSGARTTWLYSRVLYRCTGTFSVTYNIQHTFTEMSRRVGCLSFWLRRTGELQACPPPSGSRAQRARTAARAAHPPPGMGCAPSGDCSFVGAGRTPHARLRNAGRRRAPRARAHGPRAQRSSRRYDRQGPGGRSATSGALSHRGARGAQGACRTRSTRARAVRRRHPVPTNGLAKPSHPHSAPPPRTRRS